MVTYSNSKVIPIAASTSITEPLAISKYLFLSFSDFLDAPSAGLNEPIKLLF
jgi:hypothetical protein